MAQSLNTKVDLTVKATWFRSLAIYGQAMVGDKAFEFYNDKNVEDYVQIPWNEVAMVVADVRFGGKWIPRFEIRTKRNGKFIFATRDTKKTLRAIAKYVPANNMRRALGFWQTIGRGFKNIFKRNK